MMRRPLFISNIGRSLALLRGALVPLVLFTAPAFQVYAQVDTKASADATSQGEEFARQKDDLIGRLKNLKSKIDGAGRTITAKANAAEVARGAIEELRAVVSPLLAAVADDGDVSELGAKALKNATERKKALEGDLRFTAEQRQLLVNAWELRIQATTQAVAELEKERLKFLQLMYMLQNHEAFIGELAAINAQDEVIKTIRELAKALNETSVDVNNLIASFNRPGV